MATHVEENEWKACSIDGLPVQFVSVTTSDSGKNIGALSIYSDSNKNKFYHSSDYGKTFDVIQLDQDYSFTNIVGSSSGETYAIIGIKYSTEESSVFISTDSGSTWEKHLTLRDSSYILNIAMNGKGDTIMIVGYIFKNEGISKSFAYISKNRGIDWDPIPQLVFSNTNILGVCMNQEGSIIAVCGIIDDGDGSIESGKGILYISHNSGISWFDKSNKITSIGNLRIACNQKGDRFAIFGINHFDPITEVYNGFISVCKDDSWTTKLEIPNFIIEQFTGLFNSIAMNDSGDIIGVTYVDSMGSQLQLSLNGGDDWVKQTKGLPEALPYDPNDPNFLFNNNYYTKINMNASGDFLILACAGKNGNLYIFNMILESNICFAAGTLILTDQGYIPIEHIDPVHHTINGNKRIHAITKTQSNERYYMLIKKHAFGKNLPFRNTRVSKDHLFLVDGNLVPAYTIENTRVKRIQYHHDPLYNVLLDKHSTIIANGLTAETLDPRSPVAKYFKKKCAGVL